LIAIHFLNLRSAGSEEVEEENTRKISLHFLFEKSKTFTYFHSFPVLLFIMRLSIAFVSCLGAVQAFVPHLKRRPLTFLSAKPKIFIDGEAGTTGLQVHDRLSGRDDLELISAPSELRKDEATRKKLINEADVVILCKFSTSWRGGRRAGRNSIV
jgi:hypothetical protein